MTKKQRDEKRRESVGQLMELKSAFLQSEPGRQRVQEALGALRGDPKRPTIRREIILLREIASLQGKLRTD